MNITPTPLLGSVAVAALFRFSSVWQFHCHNTVWIRFPSAQVHIASAVPLHFFSSQRRQVTATASFGFFFYQCMWYLVCHCCTIEFFFRQRRKIAVVVYLCFLSSQQCVTVAVSLCYLVSPGRQLPQHFSSSFYSTKIKHDAIAVCTTFMSIHCYVTGISCVCAHNITDLCNSYLHYSQQIHFTHHRGQVRCSCLDR